MDYIYSHEYEDADTGEIVEVLVPDDEDDDEVVEIRNARRRSQPARRLPARRRSPSRRTQGRARRRRDVPARVERRAPVVVRERPTVTQDGQYLSVKKSAVGELIPAAGKVWASFLGTPDAPQATGNDIVDRDNASAHREALAKHQQNQVRILALTELASRAFNLFVD